MQASYSSHLYLFQKIPPRDLTYCDDIFQKVSDDAKDILEKVYDDGDDILKEILMRTKTYLRKFLMMVMIYESILMMLKTYLRKFLRIKGVSRVFQGCFKVVSRVFNVSFTGVES